MSAFSTAFTCTGPTPWMASEQVLDARSQVHEITRLSLKAASSEAFFSEVGRKGRPGRKSCPQAGAQVWVQSQATLLQAPPSPLAFMCLWYCHSGKVTFQCGRTFMPASNMEGMVTWFLWPPAQPLFSHITGLQKVAAERSWIEALHVECTSALCVPSCWASHSNKMWPDHSSKDQVSHACSRVCLLLRQSFRQVSLKVSTWLGKVKAFTVRADCGLTCQNAPQIWLVTNVMNIWPCQDKLAICLDADVHSIHIPCWLAKLLLKRLGHV